MVVSITGGSGGLGGALERLAPQSVIDERVAGRLEDTSSAGGS